MKPLLSVIMSVYNGEKYLSQAIDSILNQTFSDFELIIVNDGSEDNTKLICDKYASQDSRVIIIKNKENVGLTKSLNIALGVARGKYIGRMDGDDISTLNRFEVQLKFMESHPNIGVLGCAYQKIINDVNLSNIIFLPEEPIIIKWRLCFENPMAHPAVVIRKCFLDEIGGYDENWKVTQDYDLFIRLSKVTKLANLQILLHYWRRHDNSITTVKDSEQHENALLINQAYISEILGELVTLEDANILWHRQIKNIDDAILISNYLFRLTKAIISDSIWHKNEKKLLKKYALQKIFSYIRPYISKMKSWGLLLLFLRYNPLTFSRLLKSRIYNTLND